MMDLLLINIGLLATILFALFGLIATLRKRPGVGFWTTLFALIALVAVLAGLNLPDNLTAANMPVPADAPPLPALPPVDQLAMVAAAILLVSGVVLLIVERLRLKAALSGSRGVLGLGTGALILVGVFVGPMLGDAVIPTSPASAASAAVDSDGSTSLTAFRGTTAQVSSPPAPLPSATPQPIIPTTTPPPPRPVMPSPTPTNTMVPLVRTTATEEAPASTGNGTSSSTTATTCTGFVQNNLNLRNEASTSGEILVTIPSGTGITLTGSSEDGAWLSATYGQMSGWVSADYVLLGDRCG
jgi:hypothetical protein